MKRWGVTLAMVAAVACAKEKREEPVMSNQSPAMSADTAHRAADTMMMRDTARATTKK